MFDNIKDVPDNKFSMLAFASGTSGINKGIMLSQKNIISNIRGALQNNDPKDSFLAILPFNHTYGFNCGVLVALYKSMTVCINSDIKYLFKDIKEFNPYCIGAVPMLAEGIYKKLILEIKKKKKEKIFNISIKISNLLLKFGIDIRRLLFGNLICKNLSLILSGGAKLNHIYVSKYKELGIDLVNGYGLTECSPLVSVCMAKNNVIGSVGSILKDIDLKIADDGEILIKGPSVMLGYYKNDELTRQSFIDGYYKTGDLGYKNGNILYFTGRKSNLIVLKNGKKFSPEVIENKLLKLNYVKECIVALKKGTYKIIAKIFLDNSVKDIGSIDLKKDIDIINSELPYYMKICDFELMENEFKKTSNNKIMRDQYD